MEKPNSELGQGTDDMFSRLLNQGSSHEILKSLTGYVEPSFQTEKIFLKSVNFEPTLWTRINETDWIIDFCWKQL